MQKNEITPDGSDAPVYLVPFTKEQIAEHQIISRDLKEYNKKQKLEERRLAYQREADPLFFKWQAGEVSKQDWLDARAAVVEQYPDAEVEL